MRAKGISGDYDIDNCDLDHGNKLRNIRRSETKRDCLYKINRYAHHKKFIPANGGRIRMGKARKYSH